MPESDLTPRGRLRAKHGSLDSVEHDHPTQNSKVQGQRCRARLAGLCRENCKVTSGSFGFTFWNKKVYRREMSDIPTTISIVGVAAGAAGVIIPFLKQFFASKRNRTITIKIIGLTGSFTIGNIEKIESDELKEIREKLGEVGSTDGG